MINKFVRIPVILLGMIFFSGCVTLPPERETPRGIFHIVGRGQTVWRIAKVYEIDVNLLMTINAISDPAQLGVGQRLFIPGARNILKVTPYEVTTVRPLEKLVEGRCRRVRWSTITLHHSATKTGNAEIFDRHHRRRGMGGLFYHFVIGNGTNSGDGEIEVGWRWVEQLEITRSRDINIVLVGNFNYQRATKRQFQSLLELVSILRSQHGISLRNIRKHKDIPGETTECPGRNFPFWRLIRELQ